MNLNSYYRVYSNEEFFKLFRSTHSNLKTIKWDDLDYSSLSKNFLPNDTFWNASSLGVSKKGNLKNWYNAHCSDGFNPGFQNPKKQEQLVILKYEGDKHYLYYNLKKIRLVYLLSELKSNNWTCPILGDKLSFESKPLGSEIKAEPDHLIPKYDGISHEKSSPIIVVSKRLNGIHGNLPWPSWEIILNNPIRAKASTTIPRNLRDS